MPGDSPGEAVRRFLAPIKDAVAVLGDAHLTYDAHPQLNQPSTVTVNRGEGLRVESLLHGALKISIGIVFEVICTEPDDPRGPYRCSTRSYIHSIYDPVVMLMAFHWHPQSVSEETGPHMHIGTAYIAQAAKLHVPTPRVTVEEFIALAIDSFGVKPTVDADTWRPLLSQHRQIHERWRTWHGRTDAPTFD